MIERRAKATKKPVQEPSSLYASKIIKAGALLADTKTLLSHWDVAASVQDNLSRIQTENVFGKASRARVRDILAIFQQRFLSDESVTKALVALVKCRVAASTLDRILFFHAACSDRLLHDAVTKILLPIQDRGILDIDPIEVQRTLTKWVAEGKTTAEWNENTTLRVTQGLLATLRDFGVLQGAKNKRIAPAYLTAEAFAYVAYYLKQHQPSGAKLVDLPDWKLFFLSREGVERFLIEAQQHGLLEYHAAGSVTRLTFPAQTLEEYANVVAQRAH